MSSYNPELRCSDADREKVVNELREHYAAGRLTLEEFDERSDVAYQAKTFGALAGLTSDLPAALPEPTKPAAKPARRPNAALRGAWTSWLSVGLVCTVIWLLSVLNSGHLINFWPAWVIGPWGAIVLAGTLGGRYRQGREDPDPKQAHGDDRKQHLIEDHQRKAQMRFDRTDQRRRQRQDRRNRWHGELG